MRLKNLNFPIQTLLSVLVSAPLVVVANIYLSFATFTNLDFSIVTAHINSAKSFTSAVHLGNRNEISEDLEVVFNKIERTTALRVLVSTSKPKITKALVSRVQVQKIILADSNTDYSIDNSELVHLGAIKIDHELKVESWMAHLESFKYQGMDIQGYLAHENKNEDIRENARLKYEIKDAALVAANLVNMKIPAAGMANLSPRVIESEALSSVESEPLNTPLDLKLLEIEKPKANKNPPTPHKEIDLISLNNQVIDELNGDETIQKKAPILEIDIVGGKKVPARKADYSNGYSKKISNSVSKAIARETNRFAGFKFSKAKGSKKKAKKKLASQVVNTQAIPRQSVIDDVTSTSSGLVRNGINSTLNIKVISAKLGIGFGDYLKNFDLRPHHSSDDFLTDYGEGNIAFTSNLNNDVAVMPVSILKKGRVPTNIDLFFGKSDDEIIIPLIDTNSLNEFFEIKGLSGIGGNLLIDLDKDTEEVEVENHSKYEAKIYLDDNFKEVSESRDYSFVLITGIAPGNSLLSYRYKGDRFARKIINIKEGETLYEINGYIAEDSQIVEVFESNLMGKKTIPLKVSESEIKFFNSDSEIINRGRNRIEIMELDTPIGSRKYIEFNHLGNEIFLGTWNKKKVELPSRDYIEEMLRVFKFTDLTRKCLVQINASKGIESVNIEGSASNGFLNLEKLYLDKDGTFGDEPTELTEKIFIAGLKQGSISMKIKYLDTSVDYLQSFCSDETYLIEQL
jgi:hypothetical protein